MLGHADCDHRGAAPALGAPIYCHPAERDAADVADAAYRDYWDLGQLDLHGRAAAQPPAADLGRRRRPGRRHASARATRSRGSGSSICPGTRPGLIGLYRESDRLALVSDCFYTLDPQTGRKGGARVPHPAFDADVEQARASIRKLAELEPSAAWAGHADPVTGDVRAQLERPPRPPL